MVKPSSQFLFTLNVCVADDSPTLKTDIIEILVNVISYCVSREVSDNSNCKYHLHCYLEFGEKLYLSDLRKFFRDSFVSNFDLQCVRSRRNVLKYITKEDVDCYTNIKLSSLSFLCQLHGFVKSNRVFSVNHPFVVSHWNCYRFIEKYHIEYYLKCGRVFYGWSQVVDCFEGWSVDVCVWFNNFITTPFYFKKKHLFLYGDSDVGKTSFVSRLLSQCPSHLIYRPTYGSFCFQGWHSKFEITVFDEFDIENVDLCLLLKYLDGSTFSCPRKCLSDILVKNEKPVVIVSNYLFQNVPLSNRVQKVLATSPFWLSPEVLLSKVSIEPSVLISDDDET